eukprot:gene1472-2833_t
MEITSTNDDALLKRFGALSTDGKLLFYDLFFLKIIILQFCSLSILVIKLPGEKFRSIISLACLKTFQYMGANEGVYRLDSIVGKRIKRKLSR